MSTNSNCIFNELRVEGELCDAVLAAAGEVAFKVHALILCGCSTYFRDLFCSNPPTSQQQVYSFPDVSPNIMSVILDYAYTGSLVVTEENVLELLAGAQRFSIEDVIEACCDLLEQKICVNNCIDILKLADLHNYPDLRGKAYRYILYHFQEVAGLSPVFLQLSVQQLADLIEKDELNVRQESTVFEAIVHWINYAPEERGGHMGTLLSKVRLLLVPTEYLVGTICRNDIVKNSLACVTMVTDIVEILQEPNVESPPPCRRLPSDVLFVVGGWEGDHLSDQTVMYNVRADYWMTLNRNEAACRAFHGCVYLNGFVYCVGGCDSVQSLSSVKKFTLATQTWQDVGSMHCPRCYVSVVVLNGCIYAIGGCNGFDRFNTAERYTPETNQWTMIAPMHEYRNDAGAAVLHGKVYICGGFSWDGPLSSAECYNPNTNQWTLIASMETQCVMAGVVAYNDQIFVVGGNNGIGYVSSVMAYDPLSNSWHTVTPMCRSRSYFGIAVLEDQLYVAGGTNGNNTISDVERYDGNRWHVVQNMETPRCGTGCCVVVQNPLAATYQSYLS